MRTKINPIFAIAFAVVAMTLVIIAVWVFSMLNTPNVDLLLVPSAATATIDGEPYQSGTYEFADGVHSIKVEATGFTAQEGTFTVGGEEIIKVYVALTPTAENHDYYLNHPEGQMRLNTVGDHNADSAAAAYSARDPIFTYTPYTDEKNRFRVFAEPSDDTITLDIRLNTCSSASAELYSAAAKDWLSSIIDSDHLATYQISFSTLCD